MNYTEAEIHKIIQEVVKQTLETNKSTPISASLPAEAQPIPRANVSGVYDSITDAIDAAHEAYRNFAACTMQERQRYIDAIKTYVQKEKGILSRRVVEETGLGNYEDKILKHELAARTYGTEILETRSRSGDTGISLIEQAPFGVIGATTPVTNPTETIINNTISMIASGNTVVFNVHPGSKIVCAYLVSAINRVIQSSGGPANVITMVKNPSMASLEALAQSPKINLLVGTGGPGLVSALLKSGKKAIGAGAGNPPVVVDETAVIEKAAADIIIGHSFDNNIICILEKEVFVVESVADRLIEQMKRHKACCLDKAQTERLLELILESEPAADHDRTYNVYEGRSYHIKKEWVGKDAHIYLDKLGIAYGEKPKCILCETAFEHPFVQLELLMPVLPIVRVKHMDEAIDLAVQAEHGNRHTAVIHSQNITNITKFAKAINTTIFVKNAPSLAGLGIGSEGVLSYTIAGPTGEGITTARSFTRARHCILVDGFRIL